MSNSGGSRRPNARAGAAAETDWRQIARLYDTLLRVAPSPVVELNRAVAVAMAEGPEAGLALLDALEARGLLRGYHLLPAARADMLRRLGRWPEAREAYRQALGLVASAPERRFLERRLAAAEAGALTSSPVAPHHPPAGRVRVREVRDG